MYFPFKTSAPLGMTQTHPSLKNCLKNDIFCSTQLDSAQLNFKWVQHFNWSSKSAFNLQSYLNFKARIFLVLLKVTFLLFSSSFLTLHEISLYFTIITQNTLKWIQNYCAFSSLSLYLINITRAYLVWNSFQACLNIMLAKIMLIKSYCSSLA